ncbi:MAG: hypothetical protein RL154_1563, partial [Pseudomonadota bacterium]
MNLDLLSIVAVAFAGSFGHCLGMCGGLVLAYSSAKMDSSLSKNAQLIRHLAYHFGRISVYIIIGIIAGFFGSFISLKLSLAAPLYVLAGLIMLLTAFAMLGISKALLSIEYSLQKYSWFKKSFSFLIKSQSLASFYGLGALNGLFPCGFVYFFLAKAAVSGSFYGGALTMAIFGLATIPALTLLGSSASFFRN